jgi:hypothetical protein
MLAHYPVSVITDGMGLNITVMSYCGHLDFGIVADREQMRDVWKLIAWLRDALEELRPTDAPAEVPGEDGGASAEAVQEERPPAAR